MTKGCHDLPDEEEALQKSNCTGYIVAAHSVWTEMECLDNCLRHPRCNKYIFSGPGNQACKLLIVNITGVLNLPETAGACGPSNITVSVSKKVAINRRYFFKCHVLIAHGERLGIT